jgi:hypothetical protein
MPDFDANEDPIRMPDAGPIDPLDPGPILRPVTRRIREFHLDHLPARSGKPKRRVDGVLLAQRRRATRCACPYGRRVPVVGTPLRHRRRLWTLCHGLASGSPS